MSSLAEPCLAEGTALALGFYELVSCCCNLAVGLTVSKMVSAVAAVSFLKGTPRVR